MAEQARVYGMADQANRHPPAAQGMRGENRPERLPEYAHNVTLGDGRTVTVAQDSGVAYAEATGRTGRGGGEELEVEFTPERSRDWRWPALFFGLIGVAGGLYAAERARRSGEQRQRFAERAVPARGDVGGGLGDRNVGHQSGIGLRPGGEITDERQIDFQPAR